MQPNICVLVNLKDSLPNHCKPAEQLTLYPHHRKPGKMETEATWIGPSPVPRLCTKNMWGHKNLKPRQARGAAIDTP